MTRFHLSFRLRSANYDVTSRRGKHGEREGGVKANNNRLLPSFRTRRLATVTLKAKMGSREPESSIACHCVVLRTWTDHCEYHVVAFIILPP